jgi:hypothetical protein
MSQALTSLSAVKEYLGVAGTDDDALLTDLVARVSDGIVTYCGREFAAADYEEYHDGEGTDSVLLNQRPVTDVLALSDDGVEVAADDFVVYPELGIVRLKSGVFGRGARSVYVGYHAGYDAIPGDVEQAAVQWTAELYQSCGAAGEREIKSERVGDYAVTYDRAEDSSVPAEVRAALEPYRVAVARAVR